MPLCILVEETQLKVGYWCKTLMCTLLAVLAIMAHKVQLLQIFLQKNDNIITQNQIHVPTM